MPVIHSAIKARQNPHKLLGMRYEGQHAEASNITSSTGDEFWAWDTGYVLRDNGEGNWEIWFRTLPVERAFAFDSTFQTASF